MRYLGLPAIITLTLLLAACAAPAAPTAHAPTAPAPTPTPTRPALAPPVGLDGKLAQAAGGYYYGYFSPDMPDLNYANPAVTAAMREVTRYWLQDMGADGFRLDAVKHLFEEGRRLENVPTTHEWLRGFGQFYRGIRPAAFTVGEVWNTSDISAQYVGAELDTVFDFPLAEAILQSAVSGRKVNVERAQQTVLALFNLGFKPAQEYSLNLAAGPLHGAPGVKLLLGTGDAAAPTVNATGGFDAYRPLPSLPPHSVTIIQLGP